MTCALWAGLVCAISAVVLGWFWGGVDKRNVAPVFLLVATVVTGAFVWMQLLMELAGL